MEVEDEILWEGRENIRQGSLHHEFNLAGKPANTVATIQREPSGECMQHEKELKIGFRRKSRRPELSVVIRYR